MFLARTLPKMHEIYAFGFSLQMFFATRNVEFSNANGQNRTKPVSLFAPHSFPRGNCLGHFFQENRIRTRPVKFQPWSLWFKGLHFVKDPCTCLELNSAGCLPNVFCPPPPPEKFDNLIRRWGQASVFDLAEHRPPPRLCRVQNWCRVTSGKGRPQLTRTVGGSKFEASLGGRVRWTEPQLQTKTVRRKCKLFIPDQEGQFWIRNEFVCTVLQEREDSPSPKNTHLAITTVPQTDVDRRDAHWYEKTQAESQYAETSRCLKTNCAFVCTLFSSPERTQNVPLHDYARIGCLGFFRFGQIQHPRNKNDQVFPLHFLSPTSKKGNLPEHFGGV